MTTTNPEAPLLIPEVAPTPQELALVRVIGEVGLSTSTADNLRAALMPLFLEGGRLMDEAEAIVVTDATQKTEMNNARKKRLAIREVRVQYEHRCDDAKSDAIKIQKGIIGIKNFGVDKMKAVEARLENAEKFAERIEAQRKAELIAARKAILAPFEAAGYDTSYLDLEATDAQFNGIVNQFRALMKANADAAAKAESDRIAAETARLAEEARVREDNLRLQKEAEAREAAHKEELAKQEKARRDAQEKADQERLALEQKANTERQAAELKLVQERRETAERECVAADKARGEREAAEEIRRKEVAAASEREAKERMAREAAERELAAKNAAEEKKHKAELAAKKKAELAPDNAKLRELAKALRGFPMPNVKSPDAVTTVEHISRELAGLAAEIEDAAKD